MIDYKVFGVNSTAEAEQILTNPDKYIHDDVFIRYGIYDEDCVHGDLKDIGVLQCAFYDIDIRDFARSHGGPIYAHKGDFAAVHIFNRASGTEGGAFLDAWDNYLVEQLLKCGLNVNMVNNDICIKQNGLYYKFCGTMHTSITINGQIYYYDAIHISIPEIEKLSLLYGICLKRRTEKIPCGLAYFGITQQQVINWFTEFVEKFYSLQAN